MTAIPVRRSVAAVPGALTARLVTLVGLLSVTLVRLPNYVGSKSLLQPLILMVLVLCIAWALPRQPRGSLAGPSVALAVLYPALIFISLLRGAHTGAFGNFYPALSQGLTYVCFVVLGIVLMTTATDSRERDQRCLAIALAPVLYVVVNTVMNLGGMQVRVDPTATGLAAPRPASVLALLGLDTTRARLPLSTSINLYSIVAAASLVVVIILWRSAHRPLQRRALELSGIACVYCLLLGDSRGAMAVAVVVTLLFVIPVAPRLPGWGVGLLVPLLPLLFLGVLKIVASPSLDGGLTRSGTGIQSAATGTGRLYIWEGAWSVLKHFPSTELIGWGAGGHITSGASLNYAFVFGGNSDAVQVFTHNVVLQTLFDTGIVGLVVLALGVGMSWSLMRDHVARTGSPAVLALMATLLVIVLQGMTEVSPSYYAQEALLATLLIMGAAVGLRRRRWAGDD